MVAEIYQRRDEEGSPDCSCSHFSYRTVLKRRTKEDKTGQRLDLA